MNFLCSISIRFNVSHTINQSKRRSLYNLCFNMIIQDKKKMVKNPMYYEKGFFLRDNMSKIRPLNTSLQPDKANVCFINSTQKNGTDKRTI